MRGRMRGRMRTDSMPLGGEGQISPQKVLKFPVMGANCDMVEVCPP